MREPRRDCSTRLRRRAALLTLAVGVLAVPGAPALAAADAMRGSPAPALAPYEHGERVDGLTVQRGSVSLQEAVAIAERRFPGGRVVRAETRTRNGSRVHEIRIIDREGRVRTVRIDADSGESR